VFEDWLIRGSQKRTKRVYRDLALAVLEAMGQARVAAEVEVHKDDPMAWLTRGPGKETETKSGWTVSVKPVKHEAQQVNIILNPGMQALMMELLSALAPFPEARKAVAGLLQAPTESGKIQK
jgi:hypothetical protein